MRPMIAQVTNTLPETNIAHEIPNSPVFPGKYHHNGGFSSQLC